MGWNGIEWPSSEKLDIGLVRFLFEGWGVWLGRFVCLARKIKLGKEKRGPGLYFFPAIFFHQFAPQYQYQKRAGYMYVTHIYSLLGFRLVCLGLASLLGLGGIRTHWARKARCAGQVQAHTHAALLFSWAAFGFVICGFGYGSVLKVLYISKKVEAI